MGRDRSSLLGTAAPQPEGQGNPPPGLRALQRAGTQWVLSRACSPCVILLLQVRAGAGGGGGVWDHRDPGPCGYIAIPGCPRVAQPLSGQPWIAGGVRGGR